MPVPLEIRADILKALMQEDRSEIRLLKDRIFSVCSVLTVSSFAVTAFLFGTPQTLGKKWNQAFLLLVDVSFIALLWMLFARLKIDLTSARQCLQVRERMIRDLDKE